MRSLLFGSGVVLSIALLLAIVALATPAWIVGSTSSAGLIKGLIGSRSVDGFAFYGPPIAVSLVKGDAEKVAIAFLVLAMAGLLPACILVIFAARVEGKDKMAKIGGVLAVVSALFLVVAMAAYTGLRNELVDRSSTVNWGYSYAVGWAAFGLALQAGLFSIFAN